MHDVSYDHTIALSDCQIVNYTGCDLFQYYSFFVDMPRAYSDDLRWVAVSNRFFYKKSFKEIARMLFMCPESVRRYCRLFRAHGSVNGRRTGRLKGSTSLIQHEEYVLVEAILKRPEIQLSEIADEIARTTGNHYHISTICRAVHRLGFTRKKVIILIILLVWYFKLIT